MAGFSEVLQTMGAMVIFGLILMNATMMIQRNSGMMVEGELEHQTIALAQNILDEARSKDFDEESIDFVPINIPDDFTASGSLGPEGESSRDEFDDFDDYDGWSTTVSTEHGNDTFTIEAWVYYVEPPDYEETASRTAFKKIEVIVKSPYLTSSGSNEQREYTFEFIRNYYAD